MSSFHKSLECLEMIKRKNTMKNMSVNEWERCIIRKKSGKKWKSEALQKHLCLLYNSLGSAPLYSKSGWGKETPKATAEGQCWGRNKVQ